MFQGCLSDAPTRQKTAATSECGNVSTDNAGRCALGARGGYSDSAWLRDAPAPWWVVHTRSRMEKVIADRFAENGIVHYLPLITIRHVYAKSRVAFDVPLFPGYFFLNGDASAYEFARHTHRVANVLPVRDQERLRVELTHICSVIATGEAVTRLSRMEVGQRCRVVRGPLRGVEGDVTQFGAKCRLVLSVAILGQSAMVEVDAGVLEILR